VPLLLLCWLLAACKEQQARAPESPVTIGFDCSGPLHQYEALNTSGLSDSALIPALIAFYTHTAAPCRDQLISAVTVRLYRLAYANPAIRTGLSGYLQEWSEDPALSDRNKMVPLLKLVSYFIYIEENMDTAIYYAQRAGTQEQRMDDTLSKMYHAVMGEITLRQSKLQEASTHYLKAITLAEKLKDTLGIAGYSLNYANIYGKLRDFRKSIAMRKKALAMFSAMKEQNGIFICYQGIGSDFGNLGNYDSALAYNRICLRMLESGFSNHIVSFKLYSNMGSISAMVNRHDMARVYFDKAKEELDQMEYNADNEMLHIMNSTVSYAAVRDVSREVKKITEYIPVFYEKNDLFDVRDAYYSLYNIAAIRQEPALALEYYQRWDSLKNVLASQDNRKYLAELETRYETQKKELTIRVQKKELTQKNTLNILLWSLLTVAGMGAAFTITRIQLSRNKKDAALHRQFTARLLQQTEEERARIARDLHDGISQELLLLKNEVRADLPEAAEKIDHTIEEIRMISRNLHPVMLDKIGLKYSIEHVCNRMMEHHRLFITADIDYNQTLPKNSELQLFRIIQEALNNTVKYAHAQAAKVTLKETKHQVTVTIQDNGKGFDVEQVLASKQVFGLQSIIERSRSLQGRADIQSSAKGTIIYVEIPI